MLARKKRGLWYPRPLGRLGKWLYLCSHADYEEEKLYPTGGRHLPRT